MHLCTVKTVIWQICSNLPGKKVPQSARLSAGGCNRYLGNAQIEVPLIGMGLALGTSTTSQGESGVTQLIRKSDLNLASTSADQLVCTSFTLLLVIVIEQFKFQVSQSA